jgi:GNAT superfamily N-acetyltransferase
MSGESSDEGNGTSAGWTIRAATESDAEAIASLSRLITRRDIAADFPPEAQHFLDQALGPEQVRANMRGTCRYLVAEAGEDLLGVVATRDDRHLLKLFVADAARGQGLARALWERARQASVAAGYRGPFTVSAATGAVPVYERLGFRPSGPATIEDGITRVPMSTADPSDA